MKDIKDFINEGWPGNAGDKAYDKILEVWENMKQEEILSMIWNYFSQNQLQDLYKWMEQDGYFK